MEPFALTFADSLEAIALGRRQTHHSRNPQGQALVPRLQARVLAPRVLAQRVRARGNR